MRTEMRLIAGLALLAPIAPATAAGPYAVGKRSYTFVDTTRPTSANGTYPGAPREWQHFMRYSAAHSTAVVDDTNSTEIADHGAAGEVVGYCDQHIAGLANGHSRAERQIVGRPVRAGQS